MTLSIEAESVKCIHWSLYHIFCEMVNKSTLQACNWVLARSVSMRSVWLRSQTAQVTRLQFSIVQIANYNISQ